MYMYVIMCNFMGIKYILKNCIIHKAYLGHGGFNFYKSYFPKLVYIEKNPQLKNPFCQNFLGRGL